MDNNWKPGFYKTNSGKTVEVLAVRDGTVIGWCEGDAETWNLEGKFFDDGRVAGWDLLPDRCKDIA